MHTDQQSPFPLRGWNPDARCSWYTMGEHCTFGHTQAPVCVLSPLSLSHTHAHVQRNTHFPLPPPAGAAAAPSCSSEGQGRVQSLPEGPDGTKPALPFITSSPVAAESKIRQVATATMKHFTPFLLLGFGSETTQGKGSCCQGWEVGPPGGWNPLCVSEQRVPGKVEWRGHQRSTTLTPSLLPQHRKSHCGSFISMAK